MNINYLGLHTKCFNKNGSLKKVAVDKIKEHLERLFHYSEETDFDVFLNSDFFKNYEVEIIFDIDVTKKGFLNLTEVININQNK